MKTSFIITRNAVSRHKLMKRNWQLYLFLIPPVIYILLFAYVPMYGAQIAFRDYVASSGITQSTWVGLKHFNRFIHSFQFRTVVPNTIRLSVYMIATSFPLAIIFALSLNSIRSLRYKKFVQTVTYIPHFISTVVMVGILFQILSPVTGIYGNLYTLFGGSGYPTDLLGKAKTFIHLYNWSGIWQSLGWDSIIYIAALSSVDPQLHEAALIDGATMLQRIMHIDFPSILPTASIMLILSAGGIMSVGFEKVFLMQNPLNLTYSEVLSTYVYKVGMEAGGGNYSYSAAISLFNSCINCFVLIAVNGITKKMNTNSLF